MSAIDTRFTVRAMTWMEAMLREDFPAAWAIADDCLAARDSRTRDDPSQPYHERWVWDGQDLGGQRVVVRCYHGLGDTLQFMRFLPALRALAGHVTLEVQPQLHALAELHRLADTVVPFDVARPIEAGVDIEIMELPHALRSLPGAGPYLHVPATPPGPARTGVCWQAGGWDSARSIPLEQLRPFVGEGAVSLLPGASGLPDPLAGNMDILALASLIAGLERVITVDTMIAHLAGALGRPVHLLLRAEADWRWGRADRSMWYPRTRLHRQRRDGDWSGALDSLDAALKAEG